MKTAIAFFVFGLAVVGCAQTSLTFTSPDGLFRFSYSDILVNCIPEDHPGSSSFSDVCVTQGEICGGPGSEGRALACFAYPKERFQEKPNFVAATFFVSEIKSAKTEKACLEGSPDWLVLNPNAGTTDINGIHFKVFEIGDNWTSGGQSGPAYRTFHDGKCYELGLQTFISRAEYDPGTVKPFTKKDQAEVEGRLRQALNSFLFLK